MDRSEFESLALEQLDAVYRALLHLMRNPEQAEELVQEVYVCVFKPEARERFMQRARMGVDGTAVAGTPAENTRAWLFTIVHNTFYSMIKGRRSETGTGAGVDDLSDLQVAVDVTSAWDSAGIDWEQVDERLKSAVDQLKPEYRQVLLLWGVYGKRYREIAEMLEVPLGTVMSRLFRARKVLADSLGGTERAAAEFGARPAHGPQSTDPEPMLSEKEGG